MECLAFFRSKLVQKARTYLLHGKSLLTFDPFLWGLWQPLKDCHYFLPYHATYLQGRKFSNIIILFCNNCVFSTSFLLCSLVGTEFLKIFWRLFIWLRLPWCGSQGLEFKSTSTWLFTTVFSCVASIGLIFSSFISLYYSSLFFIVVTI